MREQKLRFVCPDTAQDESTCVASRRIPILACVREVFDESGGSREGSKEVREMPIPRTKQRRFSDDKAHILRETIDPESFGGATIFSKKTRFR